MSFFISVEGPEGAGKTTFLKQLKAHYELFGIANRYCFTREPGGSARAELIRQGAIHFVDGEESVPAATFLSMLTCRLLNIHNLIIPKLYQGTMVITDRYSDSTAVLQLAESQENQHLYSDIIKHPQMSAIDIPPDLTIFLTAPTALLNERMKAKITASDTNTLDAVYGNDKYTLLWEEYVDAISKHSDRLIMILHPGYDIAAVAQDIASALHRRYIGGTRFEDKRNFLDRYVDLLGSV